MSRKLSTIVFVIIFLVGLSVMLYPTFSNWWNLRYHAKEISKYKEVVAKLDNSENERLLEEAHAYNEKLAELPSPFVNFDKIEGYENILDVSGTGIMGYVSIPVIRVELPIYHGASESVLQVAAGHVQGSSLPVGGKNTHAVISGHRGLPSARLFTDLDRMVVGDTFTVNILNEILTYEVEKILIILPTQTNELSIIPDGDYVTLMTCTPYGINSHRLLIRSKRIDTLYEHTVRVSADAVQVDPVKTMPFMAVPLLGILMIIWKVISRRSKKTLLDEMRRKYRR